jgi:TPR repeat protein
MKFFLRAKDLNCEWSPRTNVSITEVYYLVMFIISQVDIYVVLPQYVNIYDTLWPMSKSGNLEHCPFCKAERLILTDEEKVGEVMKRVKANDASAMCLLSNMYHGGLRGLEQDQVKTMELLTRAVELGYGEAQYNLGVYYYDGGDLKKAKLHYECGFGRT